MMLRTLYSYFSFTMQQKFLTFCLKYVLTLTLLCVEWFHAARALEVLALISAFLGWFAVSASICANNDVQEEGAYALGSIMSAITCEYSFFIMQII